MGINEQDCDVSQGFTALEFFAGIGLARAGMEAAGIATVWANDYDKDKKAMYEAQWGAGEYLLRDVHEVSGGDLPKVSVAWSSSPCTDLSLAGARHGLRNGRESSAFFGFSRVISEMGDNKPDVIVLENVVGLSSSHDGDDLRAAAQTFNDLGYAVDVIVLDARRFVAQSRPRLFLIGAIDPPHSDDAESPLRPDSVSWLHSDSSIRTYKALLPVPPDLVSDGFTSLVEELENSDPRWWDENRVRHFVESMSSVQRARLDALVNSSKMTARTAYRRTRAGKPVWEMRADDISGCLRTARGGSSKQAVAIMGNGSIRVRWMTGLEYARLMGAGWFNLSGLRESQVHYGFGDAVAVPAVTWVAEHMILPALRPGR